MCPQHEARPRSQSRARGVPLSPGEERISSPGQRLVRRASARSCGAFVVIRPAAAEVAGAGPRGPEDQRQQDSDDAHDQEDPADRVNVDTVRLAGRLAFPCWFVIAIFISILPTVAVVMLHALLCFLMQEVNSADGPPMHGHTGLEITSLIMPSVLVTSIAIVSAIDLSRN